MKEGVYGEGREVKGPERIEEKVEGQGSLQQSYTGDY